MRYGSSLRNAQRWERDRKLPSFKMGVVHHGLVLGLCALSGDYFLTSNRESGNGRFDIQMMPQKKNLPGLIIELKAADEPENLKKLADAALQQIDEKKYDTQLKSTGVTKIVKYGIAFCAKDVEISSVMNWF